MRVAILLRRRAHILAGLVFVAVVFSAAAIRAGGFDLPAAVRLAKKYLASDDADERERLAKKLAVYPGEIQPVLDKLSARSFTSITPGYHPKEHFSDPALLEKYPDDLLYFTVPKSYRPRRPTGLVVFLHGGGNTSSRTTPRYFMDYPDEDEEEDDTFQLGNLFEKIGMIGVGPSAPWDEESSYRWCLSETDDYLAAVIRECKRRFNIDADRVFLAGHSMGGFGAYHHLQRQPDRFAAVVAHSGSWQLAYLPAMAGTRLCVVHGLHDAEEGVRWHYTDIDYARWTHKLLNQAKIDHVYYQHDRGHGLNNGKEYILRFFESAQDLRRDPYAAHVVLASPVGFTRYYCFPVEHNRWLTLDEASEGTIEYDELRADNDVEFDEWKLRHTKSRRDGAAIDAVNQGHNTIIVKTQNVERFTVWLHPRMIDVNRPVKIVVDGQTRFNERVQPSLATALESYERREDWGLIYPIKIKLALAEGE